MWAGAFSMHFRRQQSVRTARGGRWYVSNVKNVIDRAPVGRPLFKREILPR
jgi:hypothetical protein